MSKHAKKHIIKDQKSKEQSKIYGDKYRQRPDVKTRMKAYLQEYNQKPRSQNTAKSNILKNITKDLGLKHA